MIKVSLTAYSNSSQDTTQCTASHDAGLTQEVIKRKKGDCQNVDKINREYFISILKQKNAFSDFFPIFLFR